MWVGWLIFKRASVELGDHPKNQVKSTWIAGEKYEIYSSYEGLSFQCIKYPFGWLLPGNLDTLIFLTRLTHITNVTDWSQQQMNSGWHFHTTTTGFRFPLVYLQPASPSLLCQLRRGGLGGWTGKVKYWESIFNPVTTHYLLVPPHTQHSTK